MKFEKELNKNCKNYIQRGDDVKCKIKMDMDFCSNRCAFATNVQGSTKSYNAPVYIVDCKGKSRRG